MDDFKTPMTIKDPFADVIGHEAAKKEILSVVEWFMNSEQYKARGVKIPRGFLLVGPPGNGKSMLIRDIAEYTGCTRFYIGGNEREHVSMSEAVYGAFADARQWEKSIVIIDEIDHLIARDERVVRALKECLDGVDQNDDILVLAATNNPRHIDPALKRSGRLEKTINIGCPEGDEAVRLLHHDFERFGVPYPADADDKELALCMSGGLSFADVDAVANDVVLRNGTENITAAMVIDSISNVRDGKWTFDEKPSYPVAIHESGHAVMALAFPKYYIPVRVTVLERNGYCASCPTNNDDSSFGKAVAYLQIALGGLLAEKVILGEGSTGAMDDLRRTQSTVFDLFACDGYSSAWETLSEDDPSVARRTETATKLRRIERKVERLIRQLERKTRRYISAHRAEVIALANVLMERGHLSGSEIAAATRGSFAAQSDKQNATLVAQPALSYQRKED